MKILQSISPNLNDRSISPDMILIHYTDMTSANDALRWMCNPKSNVSAHYLIDEAGLIYQMVPEDKQAWHAGESFWQGNEKLNDRSIGIEIANPGHTNGYVPFKELQIETLMRLCEGIMTRWGIPPTRILGHSDVAPRRKQDPGHLFPWKTLADAGLGLWPKSSLRGAEGDSILNALSQIGYETISPHHTLLAFQRHFQPHKVDGIADEETLSLIQGLLDPQ